MTAFEVFIPLLPAKALSPNQGQGGKRFNAHTRARREMRDATAMMVRNAPTMPHFDRARVSITYRYVTTRQRDDRYRPHDVPNAISALKPVYDGLVDAGLFPDDDWQHMALGPHRIERVTNPEDEGLLVRVQALKGEKDV